MNTLSSREEQKYINFYNKTLDDIKDNIFDYCNNIPNIYNNFVVLSIKELKGNTMILDHNNESKEPYNNTLFAVYFIKENGKEIIEIPIYMIDRWVRIKEVIDRLFRDKINCQCNRCNIKNNKIIACKRCGYYYCEDCANFIRSLEQIRISNNIITPCFGCILQHGKVFNY